MYDNKIHTLYSSLQFFIVIWITFLYLQIFISISIILLNIKSSAACNPAEYRIGVECCPMCSPGNRVNKHCTEYTSTSCVPCIGSTYLDEPNGLTACTPCTHCDPGFGLMVKHPCRPSSDTVCEPLEGFYCIDPNKDGCKSAQRHSICKPGQYIRQKGSPSTDTVCVDCTGDTYSDGSFTSCQPHTQCDLKLQEMKPGTPWSDSECGHESSPHLAAIFITIFIIISTMIGGTIYYLKRKKSETQGPGNNPHRDRSPTEESTAEAATMFVDQ
uniref:TNFR-Cys domain-containing protein n=1 Tax=Esox lucius TaxID=8010 RepID=A0AAY5L2M2_ESOLU